MVFKFICLALLITFIPRASGVEKCNLKTESGEIKSACCADSEAKGNDCLTCLNGYTSEIGQHCIPCQNNTYGERCRNDCDCPVFEICHNVEGCVKLPTTTAISEYGDTSGSTTSSRYNERNTFGKNTNNSVNGLLSTEIVLHYTLSVMVVNFGVGLCFMFYKYKSAAKEKRPTIIKSPIAPLLQNNHILIEMEDRLYDTIHDTDMLDDQNLQQMQIRMLPDYLDEISESQCTERRESTNEIYDISFQALSSATKRDEHQLDCSSSISGDNTSSSDENNQKVFQDNLNPLQQSVKMSSPKRKALMTLATIHKIDISASD